MGNWVYQLAAGSAKFLHVYTLKYNDFTNFDVVYIPGAQFRPAPSAVFRPASSGDELPSPSSSLRGAVPRAGGGGHADEHGGDGGGGDSARRLDRGGRGGGGGGT